MLDVEAMGLRKSHDATNRDSESLGNYVTVFVRGEGDQVIVQKISQLPIVLVSGLGFPNDDL